MKGQTASKIKVYVAMSGGVDSSVAAALLKKKGYFVVGVFMKQWQPALPSGRPDKGDFKCLWKEEREYAMRAASRLEIPLLTWDFTKEYKKQVADHMIREYRAGQTPNPDVMCNKEIKFGLFLKRAIREGADYIATGHYARISMDTEGSKSSLLARFEERTGTVSRLKGGTRERRKTVSEHAGRANGSERGDLLPSLTLMAARDKNKDQSYFLWTLTQKELSKTIFPIGDLTKPEVRILAKRFKLPNFDKKDSQGVCFIGELNMHDFLTRYIRPKYGKISSLEGKILGRHDGVYYYTIGQRHGLNITVGGGPYYVVRKDIKKNIIYVGKEKDLASNDVRVGRINWIIGSPKFPAEVSARIRYREPLKRAVIQTDGTIKFKDAEKAETSGQSAVFYRGDVLLGGGVII